MKPLGSDWSTLMMVKSVGFHARNIYQNISKDTNLNQEKSNLIIRIVNPSKKPNQTKQF